MNNLINSTFKKNHARNLAVLQKTVYATRLCHEKTTCNST